MARDGDDDDRWRRMPVPQPPTGHEVTIRQFRDPKPESRSDKLKQEIASKARSSPDELARLIQQWLHADD